MTGPMNAQMKPFSTANQQLQLHKFAMKTNSTTLAKEVL